MRQGMCIILAAILVLSLSAVFAADNVQNKTESQPAMKEPGMIGQEMKGQGMMGQGMMGQGMMGQGMMGQGMMGQGMMDKGKMGGGMMEKKIVATQDGGVVVWIGNKLIKYNKDLKLVNEVELKVDMAAMQQKMMENCSKMRGSSMDAHTIDPYHHKSGTTQPASGDDAHAIDPHHHAP